MEEETGSPDICLSGEFFYVKNDRKDVVPIRIPSFEYIMAAVNPHLGTLIGRMAVWTGSKTLWIYADGLKFDPEKAAESWGLGLRRDGKYPEVFILERKDGKEEK